MQKSLYFLVVFTVSYIVLNLIYQAGLLFFEPHTDPLTEWITKITVCLFTDLSYQPLIDKPGLKIMHYNTALVNIKEGCNAMAVWISILSFIIAYRANFKAYLIFIPTSFILIQLSNILRLYLLIMIKINKPEYFNFFHTYAFPAIIYLFAFLLMVLWVKKFSFIKPIANNSL